MNKVTWVAMIAAAMIAAALVLAGLHGGAALAQTPPAKETTPASPAPAATETDDAKAKAAEERKAKRAERRKARKERAERRAKASEGRLSGKERRKQCGSEWREARKAGKVEKDMTWPKFWSACNTRLKEQAEKAPADKPKAN